MTYLVEQLVVRRSPRGLAAQARDRLVVEASAASQGAKMSHRRRRCRRRADGRRCRVARRLAPRSPSLTSRDDQSRARVGQHAAPRAKPTAADALESATTLPSSGSPPRRCAERLADADVAAVAPCTGSGFAAASVSARVRPRDLAASHAAPPRGRRCRRCTSSAVMYVPPNVDEPPHRVGTAPVDLSAAGRATITDLPPPSPVPAIADLYVMPRERRRTSTERRVVAVVRPAGASRRGPGRGSCRERR